MSNRLYTVAALTAAIALSASFAISRTHHGAPQTAHASSGAGASHIAAASSESAGPHLSPAVAAAPAHRASANQNTSISVPTSGAASASTPTLVTVQGGSRVLAGGAQRATPVAVSEDQAMQAIFKGGMWLPNATGGREYAKYDHHLIHDDGDWTWVGKVQTDHGLQSAVITFGKNAVFGTVPQANGSALRLVTADGQKLLVQTDGSKMASSPVNLQLHAHQDFVVPRRNAEGARPRTASASTSSTASASAPMTASAATTSGGPTIDVMVAYTSGLAGAYGSTSAALTRINNLVDVTNQAYADSGVSQRIRLVHTMQVNYTDTNNNNNALDDITGRNSDGTTVSIPSSLQGVAAARAQYGADLVVLLRHFNNAGNGGCGVGWLIGGGEQQIIPSEDNAYGYSVVQDGSDGGYYCLNTTFAHELGHNMGSAHDRANASKDSSGNPIPGAYPYSYGYIGNGTNGFSTIMAYGSDTQTPLALFSNPNISKCQNSPCGVADTSSSSADNVHSLNNTASLIAQFEGTKVGLASSSVAHNDVNGDGKSDLFWYSPSQGLLSYWLMNGSQRVSYENFVVPSGYKKLATGDFNGDGHVDILWLAPSGAMEMWLGNGVSFTAQTVNPSAYPVGWVLAGVGDVNRDGNTDLFWYNPSNGLTTYWLMNGATRVLYRKFQTNPGLTPLQVADFDGNNAADILWKRSDNRMYIWLFNGSTFTYHYIGQYPSGWVSAGTGDVNGDGKDDLFWYNPSSGLMTYWLMNGATRITYKKFQTNVGLQAIADGNFNGDKYGDLVWKTQTGAMYMWLFNGSSFQHYYIGAYPAGWTTFP